MSLTNHKTRILNTVNTVNRANTIFRINLKKYTQNLLFKKKCNVKYMCNLNF